MKRDLIAFLLGIAMVASFCSAGIRKISPAFLPIPESNTPTLILDPGHGGVDGGASTPAGDKESDINLAIALKAESLFAFFGIDPVLTRSQDVSIHDNTCTTIREKKVSDLKNRVALVNSTQNAMLISVHQNTFTDSRYHGAQVFHAHDEQSIQWGTYTQELLRSMLDPDNGRDPAPIPDHVYLFKHINCPAILIECGFLSNGEDAALLLTDSYQRKIAAVLVGAYFHQLEMIPVPLGGE